jgi:hypothetical protein
MMALDNDLAELIDGPAKRVPYGHRPVPMTATLREKRNVTMARLDRLTASRRAQEDDGADSPVDMARLDLSDVQAVSVGWLGKVFGMDPSDVKKRLADCPPVARKKSGYVYSLPIAARYLVKPVFDVQSYLKTMKPSELPPILQNAYWDALNKKQKWEENAGQLWRTEKVIEVFGDTFKAIKNDMQLWPDTIERQTELTEAHRSILIKLIDALQDDLYKTLVKMATEKQTPSTVSENDEEEDWNDLV